MTLMTTFAKGASIAALTAATVMPAFAQDAQTTEEMPAEETATETAYSDETLGAFVVAAQAVADMQGEWVAQIEAEDDPTAQQALIEEANAAMETTVEETDGITLAEFIEIGEAAQTDPALSERIVAMMEPAAPATTDGG